MVVIVLIRVEVHVNDVVVVDSDKHLENRLYDYFEVLIHVNDDIHEMYLKKYIRIMKIVIRLSMKEV
jgi:hypothetical protein